jgi:hypothetical protein
MMAVLLMKGDHKMAKVYDAGVKEIFLMINYTLKQLYSFEAVVRLKSFTKASKTLNITQPAVVCNYS